MSHNAQHWSRYLPTWLLPAPCLACGSSSDTRSSPIGLCSDCSRRLAQPAHGCSRCGRALVAPNLPAGFLCGRCRARPPAFERLYAAWLYQPPLDQVIRALKFGRLDYLGEALGETLASRFAQVLPAVDLVVPVPLHWRRRLVRGFNQAGLIARALARELDLPCRAALRRRRATHAQSRLPRERRLTNMRRAFRSRRGRPAAGLRILLVDDVATTGATLDAAARALLHGGAQKVLALVVARTPE